MYYYYALQTMGIAVWWRRYLTSLQIVQFVVDIAGTLSWPYGYYTEGYCSGSIGAHIFGVWGLGTFLYLFVQFYKAEYTAPAVATTSSPSQTAPVETPKTARALRRSKFD